MGGRRGGRLAGSAAMAALAVTAVAPSQLAAARDVRPPKLSALWLTATQLSVRVGEASALELEVQRCTGSGSRTRCTAIRLPVRRGAACRLAPARQRIALRRPVLVRQRLCRALRPGRYVLSVRATDRYANEATAAILRRIAPPRR